MTSFKRRSRAIHVDKLSEQAVRVSLRATIYSRYVRVRVTQIQGGLWSIRPDGDWPLHEWTFITDPRLYGDLMYLMAVYGLELAMKPGTVHSIRMDKRYRERYTLADGIPYSNTASALTSGWTYYGLRQKSFNQGIQQLHGYIDRLMGVIEAEHCEPTPAFDRNIISSLIAIDSVTPQPTVDIMLMRSLLTRFDMDGGPAMMGREFGRAVFALYRYRDTTGGAIEVAHGERLLNACVNDVVAEYKRGGIDILSYFSYSVTTHDHDLNLNVTPQLPPDRFLSGQKAITG